MRGDEILMIRFDKNSASESEVVEHLREVDATFDPPLSERISIDGYAFRIVSSAQRFECWCGNRLIGLVAIYMNDPSAEFAYVTNVSVSPDRHGEGIATRLLEESISEVASAGFGSLRLDCAGGSELEATFYPTFGFAALGTEGGRTTMEKKLK